MEATLKKKSSTSPANARGRKKRARGRRLLAPRKCRFCEAGTREIDYKEIDLLRRYISTRGKILAARFTGTCALHQRKLSRAISRGRYMALLPYVIR